MQLKTFRKELGALEVPAQRQWGSAGSLWILAFRVWLKVEGDTHIDTDTQIHTLTDTQFSLEKSQSVLLTDHLFSPSHLTEIELTHMYCEMITAVGFVTIHHLIPVIKRRKVIFFSPL